MKNLFRRKQNKLNRDLHPIPNPFRKNKKTISFTDYNRIKKASENLRDFHQPEELQDFLSVDTIKDFNHLEEESFILTALKLKILWKIIF